MRRTPLLLIRIATVIVLTSASAQGNTPAIDGSIGTGEYGTNNSLQNAGNTGQTWYDVGRDQSLPCGCECESRRRRGGLRWHWRQRLHHRQPYDGTNFSSLPFPAQFVTYFKHGYRQLRPSTGGATLQLGVDITPPVVTVTGVSQGANYLRGSVPAAGCTTTDALSGVAATAK